MKFPRVSKIIFAMSALVLSNIASHGVTINFDDLAGSGVPVPLGHGGFTWNNFHFLNAQNSGAPGYLAGMVTASNVAYNGGATAASLSSTQPFNLVSAYLTGAWNHNLQVTVTGFNGVTQVATQTVTVSAYQPTLFTFNFNEITSVNFSSFGGTAVHFGGSGTHFAMDNLVVTPVPEPGAAGLALLGTALLMRRGRFPKKPD